MARDNSGLRDTFTTLRGLNNAGRNSALSDVRQEREELAGLQAAQLSNTGNRIRKFDLGSPAEDQAAIAADQNLQDLESRRVLNPRETANNLFSLVGQQGGFGAALGAGIASARADFADLVNSRIDDASKRLGRFREDRVLQRDLREAQLKKETLASSASASALAAQIDGVNAVSDSIKFDETLKNSNDMAARAQAVELELQKSRDANARGQLTAIGVQEEAKLIADQEQKLSISPESNAKLNESYATLNAVQLSPDGQSQTTNGFMNVAKQMNEVWNISETVGADGQRVIDPAQLPENAHKLVDNALDTGGIALGSMSALVPGSIEQLNRYNAVYASAELLLQVPGISPISKNILQNATQTMRATVIQSAISGQLDVLYQSQAKHRESVARLSNAIDPSTVPNNVAVGAKTTARVVTNGQ